MLRTCATSELLIYPIKTVTISKAQNLHWRQSLEEVFLPNQETHLQLPRIEQLVCTRCFQTPEPAREPRHLCQKALPISFLRTTRLDWSCSHPTWRSAGSPASVLLPVPARSAPLLFLWTSPSIPNASPQKEQGTQQREQRSHAQRKLLFVRETEFQTLVLTYLDFDKMLRNKHKGKIWSEEEACQVPTEKSRNTHAEG